MTIQARESVFYVQAGADVGLGHLMRSSAVAEALKGLGSEPKFILASDEYARTKAESLGIRTQEVDGFDCVIIDAAVIPESDALYLQQFDKRILISPVCNRADIATHVIVRALSPSLESVLAPKTSVRVDPLLTYTTSRNLKLRTLEFERIRVGICLSGAASLVNTHELIKSVAEVAEVSEIYVLGYNSDNLDNRHETLMIQKMYDESPWSFFFNINVFIGGDGLMISEAAAQGIPSISFTTKNAQFKNDYLKELGCIKYVFRDSTIYPFLQQILSERNTLEEMHDSALNQVFPDGATLIAQAIHGVSNYGGLSETADYC